MTTSTPEATGHDLSRPSEQPARNAGPAQRNRSLLIRLLGALVGLVALGTGAGLVALPLIVALAARQMPASTIVRRLALAVLALFGLNAALLTVLAVLDVPLDVRLAAALYLIAGALAPSKRTDPARPGGIASTSDWWALGAALTAFAVFYRPFAGASVGRSMAQLSFSTDAANYLGLVQQGLQQGGYVELSDYPPAWTGNVALAVDLLVGSNPTAAGLLDVAAPIIVAFYSLMVFFAVALALDVLHAVTGDHSQRSAALAVVCVGLTAFLGPTTLLLRSHSYAQMLALTILLALASLLVAPRDSDWRLPVLLGLLSVSLMQTWYLLAPVLGVMLLLYLGQFRPPPLQTGVVAVLTGLLSAYPLLKGPPPVTQLNTPGVAVLPNLLIVFTLLLLSLVAIVLLVRGNRPRRPPPLVLATLMVATLLTTVLAITVQVATGTGFGYYGAKLLFVVFLLGAIAAACAAGIEAERGLRLRTDGPSAWLFSLLVVLLLVGGLAGTSVAMRDLSLTYAAGQAPDEIDGAVLDAIFSAHPRGLDEETDAWVVDGCSRIADHIASKWTHDLFLTWNDSRRLANNLYRSGRRGDVSMLLPRTDDRVTRVEVYVQNDCEPAARAKLAASAEVTIIRVR